MDDNLSYLCDSLWIHSTLSFLDIVLGERIKDREFVKLIFGSNDLF